MATLRRDRTVIKGLRAIELFRDGFNPGEIAKMMDMTRDGVHKLFNAGGGRSPEDYKVHHEARLKKGKKVIVEV